MMQISEQLKKGKNNVKSALLRPIFIKLSPRPLTSPRVLAQKKEPIELNNYGNVHEVSNCISYFRDRYNCQKQSF